MLLATNTSLKNPSSKDPSDKNRKHSGCDNNDFSESCESRVFVDDDDFLSTFLIDDILENELNGSTTQTI